MRSAAELGREVGDSEHAHLVAVLFVEESARAGLLRLFYRHDARRDGAVSQHLLVDYALSLAQLVEADGREVVEVEAQEGRRDERAGLADVLAEHARERLVQKVRRCVVALYVGAAHGVYLRRHAVAGLYRSLGYFSFMHYEIGDGVNCVGDFKFHAAGVNPSGVSDLSALFSVERRVRKHKLGLLAFGGFVRERAVHYDGLDLGLALRLGVAAEGRRRDFVGELGVDVLGNYAARLLARGARPLALLLHGLFETVLVDGDIALGAHLFRKLEREAEGVVEHEGHVAGQLVFAGGFELRYFGIHKVAALRERAREALFLGAEHLLDGRGLLNELMILVAYRLADDGQKAGEERLVDAEQPAVAHAAPDEAAQDVAAAVVRRQDSVGYHERRGADVVGDDLYRHVLLRVLAVLDVDELAGLVHDGTEEVRLEVVRHALNDGGEALEPHAGVYILMRKRREVARFVAVVLHEDEVPYFEISVAVAADGAGRLAAGELRPLVVDYLGARPAGPDGAGGPEVVVRAETENPVRGQADLLVPDVEGLVVVEVYSRVEAVGLEADALREELPRPRDYLMLEIIAEAEVAQHFEERVVARRASDVLDVVGAHALLRRRRPRHLRRLEP